MQKEIDKAKVYAYRLFKFRARAERELITRLKRKKFSKEIIDTLIEQFKEQGLIDDNRFVQDWINARKQKGLGRLRIKFELKQKGIEEGLINERISGLLNNEYASALEIAKRQKEIISKRNIDNNKIKNRLYSFLMRRGFSSDIIREVIQELL